LILTIVSSFLMLAFAAALFRQRATALRWCEIYLSLAFAITVLTLVAAAISRLEIDSMGLISQGFSLSLLFAAYLYCRNLRSRGVLI